MESMKYGTNELLSSMPSGTIIGSLVLRVQDFLMEYQLKRHDALFKRIVSVVTVGRPLK